MLLNQLENDELIVSVTGMPVTVTHSLWGQDGRYYHTVPYYALHDYARVPVAIQGRVIGHEYRFTGLEVDISQGSEGSYYTFTAEDVLPTLEVA